MFANRLFSLLIGLFLITACVPHAAIQKIATQSLPAASSPSPTTLTGKFEVNGRSLYIECLGNGSPTIVLEPGEGGTHLDMKELQKRLSTQLRTCTYDRAHTGGLRTAQDVVDDLHALLTAAGVPSPFVLVGSSAGGLFVQLYARRFPEQVVGVVAMNPVPPAHPWLDEVNKVFTAQEYADEEAYYNGQNGESFDYLTSSQQLASAAKPPKAPFEMLISTNAQCEDNTGPCMKSYSIYEQIMQELTSTWPRGKFSQVAAGHEIYASNIDAVMTVVEHVLTSQ